MKIWIRVVLALALLALPGGAAQAKTKTGTPTTPGKYTDWDGEMDSLEVVETFKLSDYDRILVEPLDTSGVELPDPKDNTFVPVKRVLAEAAKPLAAGIAEDSPPDVLIGTLKKPEVGALVVHAKVVKMDPGSQAARYWAGFGAGAAKTGISGEVSDSRTGKVLLRFQQERRSAVGSYGGDYDDLMNRNLWTIGKDLANVLQHF
ncbi:MAG TPA: DUF4410 domain-containing protein [Thermoanaerobaculia bacterium]|jgi:hypothetical protein|nr:DUF4410 domain-containing protein [Thermoanaerobaculia bacterium]